MDLTAEELRVLGCLVEKQLTTPQQYPLTLNALTLACNQSSNRDPVVAYDEKTVEEAVTRAKTHGLARFVHPAHGRSALRYRHELGDRFGLDERQLALVAVLVLRGPQTVGELRGRTDRMVRFDDLAEVEAELDALARREEPLVVRLARAPGRKEDRFAHCLGQPGDSAPSGGALSPVTDALGAGSSGPAVAASGPDHHEQMADEVLLLRQHVDELRRHVDELRRHVDELRRLGA